MAIDTINVASLTAATTPVDKALVYEYEPPG